MSFEKLLHKDAQRRAQYEQIEFPFSSEVSLRSYEIWLNEPNEVRKTSK